MEVPGWILLRNGNYIRPFVTSSHNQKSKGDFFDFFTVSAKPNLGQIVHHP